jgi:tyrosine-protein kinase Etk/Wzc
VDSRISNVKSNLLENVESLIRGSDIAISEKNREIDLLSEKISKLPATQRQLFGIERKFRFNDAIYTFLMQKRSEAAITKASNFPDNEIIDVARYGAFESVYPKKTLNYTIALLLGLVLPIGYIMGRDYFNDKIIERKDVETITSVPILGHVINSRNASNIVVAQSPKSSVAESFRSIRTNVQFFQKAKINLRFCSPQPCPAKEKLSALPIWQQFIQCTEKGYC